MRHQHVHFISAVLVLSVSMALRANPTPPSPVSLTNPDGQALILEKYDLRVAVHGALSLTEMEMVFRNPEKRQMEGRFLYLLPPGAVISRFAKEVDGKLMEGEVVEKLRAQSIYTEILHTMRDPALLEMDQGNRFSARVFPITANGTVRLLLSYSQLLSLKNGERKLIVPLAGMTKIGAFSLSGLFMHGAEKIEINAGFGGFSSDKTGVSHQAYQAKEFVPSADMAITFKTAAAESGMSALKAGRFQMLAFRPEIAVNVEQIKPISNWSFYFDTSASNADTNAGRLHAISSLIVDGETGIRPRRVSKIGAGRIQLHAFDVDVVSLGSGDIEDVVIGPDQDLEPGINLMRLLNDRHALGATNLEAALKHIGEQARAAKAPTRFVLVSDGIATMGAREARELVAALGEWPEQHVLHALVLGNKQDEKILNAIVEKTRGRVVVMPLYPQVENVEKNAIAELTAPLGASFEFYDEGAQWIYPKTFRDVRAGSELIVFSETREGGASKPGVVQKLIGGKSGKDQMLKTPPAENAAFAPLLQREAYRAYLDNLEKLEQDEPNEKARAELRKQRVEVSVKNRVLCPLTSLLVLETEADYRRFGIERTALAEIVTIGAGGIELKKRDPQSIPAPKPVVKSEPNRIVKPETTRAAAPAKAADATDVLTPPVPRSSGRTGDIGGAEVFGVDGEMPAEFKERDGWVPTNGAAHPDGAVAGNVDPQTGYVADFPGPRIDSVASARTAPAAPLVRIPEPSLRAASELADRRIVTGTPGALWPAQYGIVPTKEQLGALRGKVTAAPLNRTVRNAMSDAFMKAQNWSELKNQALEWQPFDSENPQVYEYLGNSATALGDKKLALRAYTSIAEIAPNRAALLARSGWLLLAAKEHALAAEMFREALKNRKDDANIYRGLAMSLWLGGKPGDACTILEDALKLNYNERYGDVKRVLREELDYIYVSYLRSHGSEQGQGLSRVIASNREKLGIDRNRKDALRVTLCWETDASDVDLHVVDPAGEECFYSHKRTQTGLELYSDQTGGLGPEVIRTEKAMPGVYHVGVKYFNAGPMGVSRGVVIIMQPKDGVVSEPQILPFSLIPGGPEMRHLGAATF